MTKTINCAECDVEFTFEENPRYPRKYCLNCSAQKKASYQNSSFKHASESRPTHTPEGEPIEVVKIPPKAELNIEYTRKPKDNGFEAHLSIETVRSNALANTVEFWKCIGFIRGNVLECIEIAKQFEQYILTGE